MHCVNCRFSKSRDTSRELAVRIGINGMGRIGRQVLRQALEQTGVEVARVNDVMDAQTLAHLLRFDSTYGRWGREIRGEGDMLRIDERTISVATQQDPAKLEWSKHDVDVVLEATGKFRTRDEAAKHLEAGAKKVLVSAPGKGELDGDFIIGVNDEEYDEKRHDVISIGSCTTNCLAPLVKVLVDSHGIRHGFINTVHAYTASQNLLDGPHSKVRRGRAAAENLVPTSTGAATMIGKIIPQVEGKLDGLAIRAPVKCGSILDLTCVVEKDTDPKAVNAAFRDQARGSMRGILAVEDEPLVSSDILGTEHSAIVSARDTHVIDERMVKVLAWYDNEWAFSRRCVDMMMRMI